MTYYIRVRHNGYKYGSSAWSAAVRVSTLLPVQVLVSNLSFIARKTGSDGAYRLCHEIRNDGSTLYYNYDGSDATFNITATPAIGGNVFNNPTNKPLRFVVISYTFTVKNNNRLPYYVGGTYSFPMYVRYWGTNNGYQGAIHNLVFDIIDDLNNVIGRVSYSGRASW